MFSDWMDKLFSSEGSLFGQNKGVEPQSDNSLDQYALALKLLSQSGASTQPQSINPMQIMGAISSMTPETNTRALTRNPSEDLLSLGGYSGQSPSMQAAPAIYPAASLPNTFNQSQEGAGKNDISSLARYAQEAYPDNPVMQQVAISQAILESGAPGKMSALATKNNNLFGIKSSNTAPGTNGAVAMQTSEYMNGSPQMMPQNFSANNSALDSFLQHRNLLNSLNRYKPVLAAASPQEAFASLQKAGYATDPNYAKKLNNIYSTYVAPRYGS